MSLPSHASGTLGFHVRVPQMSGECVGWSASAVRETRPSGHLQVRGSRGQRAWYALWRDADGRHKKRLGPRPRQGLRPAHAARRDRVARRQRAQARRDATSPLLRQRTSSTSCLPRPPREPTDPRHKRDQDRTFAEACDAWLDYVEHEKALRPSTVRDYRNAVGCYLLPEFGATTLLRTIDTRRIDAYRERLLTEGELSRRTIQKILVQLYSILKRAKRKGWIDANPAEDAERVTVRRTGDFSGPLPRRGPRRRARRWLRALRRDLRDRRLHRPAHGRTASPPLARRRLRQSHRARAAQPRPRCTRCPQVPARAQRAR